jgi:hypothetical protein
VVAERRPALEMAEVVAMKLQLLLKLRFDNDLAAHEIAYMEAVP